MFHSIVHKIISIIAALSYKCFSVSWQKDIFGNFVYFNVHLLMPSLYCQNNYCTLYIDMIDHILHERAHYVANNTERTTKIKLVHWIWCYVENSEGHTSATAHQK